MRLDLTRPDLFNGVGTHLMAFLFKDLCVVVDTFTIVLRGIYVFYWVPNLFFYALFFGWLFNQLRRLFIGVTGS